MKSDFQKCMANEKNDFKGFGTKIEDLKKEAKFTYKNEEHTLKQGDVVVSAITSCTNTSNPGVMIAAGMIAKRAYERGLKIRPIVKTSLSPGSKVVENYL